MTPTSLRTVVWGNEWYAACEIFLLHEVLSLMPIKFHWSLEDGNDVQVKLAPSVAGDIARLETLVFVWHVWRNVWLTDKRN